MKPNPMTVCPTCGGNIKLDKTLFTTKINEGILVIQDVPAEICSQCGEEWLSDEVMEKIELLAMDVRKKHAIFEVLSYDAA